MNIRILGSLSLLACMVGIANAEAIGSGGADDQIWVLSTGPDVTYFTEPLSAIESADLTGTGIGGGTVTTNNPPTGGTYFNTNSFALVPDGGTAYELSVEGEDLFFSNPGRVTESVTLEWDGYVSTTASVSGDGTFAWDYAESYLLDAPKDQYAFLTDFESGSNGPTSGSAFGEGYYTIYLAPGTQYYEVQTLALNEGGAWAPTPSPAAILPFVGGLIGLARRRFGK